MGKAKDAQIILGRLNLQNTPGHLVAPATALAAIEDMTKKLVDSGQTQLATAMLSKLLGGQRGVRLEPVLAQGHAALAGLQDKAVASGLVPHTEQAKAAAKFQETYKLMAAAVTGLGNSISAALFPVLTPVIEEMTGWISANRQWLATDIGDAVKSLAGTLRGIDWARIAADLRSIAGAAEWVLSEIGFGPALGVIAGVKFGPAIWEFAKLGAAVAGVAARLLIFPVAGFLASVATLIPTIGSLRDVWLALDLAMDANPIGAVILAATALGVAGYELYEHWDGVKAFFQDLWGGISAAFENAWKRIKPIVDQIKDGFNWIGKFLPAAPSAADAERYRLTREGKLGGGPLPPGEAAPMLPAERAAMAQRLYAEARARGLDQAHALAMLGNASAESGLNPLAVGDHGTSHGLFQWHNSRWRTLQAALGARANDPIAQLDYAISRQRARDPGWFDAGSVSGLTNRWETGFEKPLHATDRTPFADRIAQALAKPIGRSTPAHRTIEHKHAARVSLDFRNLPPGLKPNVATEGAPYDDSGFGFAFDGGF